MATQTILKWSPSNPRSGSRSLTTRTLQVVANSFPHPERSSVGFGCANSGSNSVSSSSSLKVGVGGARADHRPLPLPLRSVSRGSDHPLLPSSSGDEYEVFLSFSGPDARKSFVDPLYRSLSDSGVAMFAGGDGDGDQETRAMTELLKENGSPRICMPIFSENYASSEWCLRELAQMVECRRKSNRVVILPVFYGVDPSEVDLLDGPYVGALHEHAAKHKKNKSGEPDLVCCWEQALKEVAHIKGFHLHKDAHGHYWELIELVVHKVLLCLKALHLKASDQLVGLDNHIEKLVRMLSVGSNDVRMIGIHGVGGIGKTTLAKVVYNHVSCHFNHCNIVMDVREKAESEGISFLQNQLLSKILKERCAKITDVDEGIHTIRESLSHNKVLILLDDVDTVAQLNALAGRRSWFGPGSRIIITTRSKDVLDMPEVDWAYELEKMDVDQSIQLFSRHAFQRDSPLDGYFAYSKKVADITGGLPLVLEIIGSFLYGKSKEAWEATLMELERIPHKEVKNKLRISYDALNCWQKQIFLDIACLFIGFDKRIVIHFWNDVEFFPEETLEYLQFMSLIKIGDDNRLWMHDQIRDLGREIVRQESNMEPGMQSRLWNHEEAMRTLIRQQTEIGTRVLKWSKSSVLKSDRTSQYRFTCDHFTSLSGLWFLQVNGMNLAGKFENLLSQLRWLRWHYCPAHFSATNFNLRNLVILDLSWSEITESWDGWHQIKMAKNLKVLELKGCTRLSRNPDFSPYASLEVLNLEGCQSLVGIDASISGLKDLLSLNMKNCHLVQELPKLGSAEALTELLVDGTSIQEISFPLEGMKKLETLSACDCKSLIQIRSSIGQLESLSYLALDNAKISRFPDSIGALAKLQHLSLRGCRSISKLPDTIGQLESLVELDLSSTGIVELPHSISNLRNLRVLKMEQSYIKRLPFVTGMPEKLEEIHAKGCDLVGEIPSDIGKLTYLRVLSLSENRICRLPASICRLSHLQTLDLECCKELIGLPKLPSSLITLRLSSRSMEKIPDLSNLINMRNLYLSDCSHLQRLPTKLVEDTFPLWLEKLSNLQTLHLSLSKISSLPANLGSLSQLKKLVLSCPDLQSFLQLPSSLSALRIQNCKSMAIVFDLSNLHNLSELELHHSAVSEIQGLEGLESLQVFNMSCCKLTKLDGLERLESLRRLVLHSCELIDILPDLSNLKMLKEFSVQDCRKLLEIRGLGKMESLKNLKISDCSSIVHLPDMSNLKMLKSLEISNCDSIIGIEGLDRLESLEELLISRCKSLERLPNLGNLKKLKVFVIESCEKISDVKGLDQMDSLENLNIISCKSMERLPSLSNFKSLKSLYIEGCEKIREIVGLAGSRSIMGDSRL